MGRDFPLQHLLNIFSDARAKAKTPADSEAFSIRIEVRGGVVQHVSNVLPGWNYEIIDYDNAECPPKESLVISGLMPRDFVCVHEISWTRI
jgi:hypothetical protein